MGGAYLVAVILQHVDQGQWVANLRDIVVPGDVLQGFIKAIFFGFMVAAVGCYQGYHATGGGRGVGGDRAAARLEAANKELGSTICIGPEAASRCDPVSLRPLGTIALRGRDEPYAVFEPWPEQAPLAWRERYRAAFAVIEQDTERAAGLFEQLAAEQTDDPVPLMIAARLRSRAKG